MGHPWVRALGSLLLLAGHGLACWHKVFEVDEKSFSEVACRLEASTTWTYGYMYTQHGAVLAKARNPQGSMPIGEVCPEDKTTTIMARELQEFPWRAAGELMLYLLLMVWWFWGARGLFEGLRVADRRRPGRLAFAAFSWVLPWTIFLLPLLVIGYGDPLYSNLLGPGALSATTVAGSTSVWGEAVSYSAFVRLAFLPPLLLWDDVNRVVPEAEVTSNVGAWLVGSLLWGALGLARESLRGPVRMPPAVVDRPRRPGID